ncbi:MAG: transglycosylase domain-containing protein [Candidatus Dormibacteria bacterium]
MTSRHGVAAGRTLGPQPRRRGTNPPPRAHRAGGRRGPRKRWLVLSGVLLALGALVIFAGAVWASYSADLPSVESFGTATLSQITRIYASDGTTLLQERYGQNRTVVPLDHISLPLQRATVAIEDREFYNYKGFDGPRIASAAYYDLTHRQAARGASTITQQVVKNSTVFPDLSLKRTPDRKVKEFILAIELENHYTKPRILEMYLNSIYYGNGAYGIEAAASTYFGQHARDLALPEASFLAGIPQNPTLHDPLTDEGYLSARARQGDILKAMVTAKYITSAEADEALAKELKPAIQSASKKAPAPSTSLAPHFVDYVLEQLRLKYGSEVVNRGGLTVVTTLSPRIQQMAQAAVVDEVAAVARATRPGRDPDGQPAAGPNTGAMLVLSPQTGAILGMVGSVDYNNKAINGAVNHTVYLENGGGELHQVGSSFKPYTYATALANGYTAGSVLDDGHPNFKGYAPGKQPADFDGRQLGNISLATSLQQSRNLSSMHLFEALGAQRVFATAEALGVQPRFLTNTGVAATLGTNEVPMIEHVAAYGAFANGGRRVHPWGVARVTDSQGHVLEDNKGPRMEQAIPAEVSGDLTEILKGSEKPAGWNIPFPVAMKSGTTEHFNDSWYVGYTSDLVMGVWMARTDAHGAKNLHQNGIYGENGSGLILRDFVHSFYQGRAPAAFPPPRRATCATGPAASPSHGPAGPSAIPFQFAEAVTGPSPTPLKPCPSPVPRPSGSPVPTPAPAPASSPPRTAPSVAPTH